MCPSEAGEIQGVVVVEGGGERKGMVGMVGIMGFEGMLGMLGILGIGILGKEKGGSGRFGKTGKGGTFPWGKVGNVVCRRLRDANAMSMLEKEIAMTKAKMMQL